MLIYVRHLDRVFALAHRVLRAEGVFVFSTEAAGEEESSEAVPTETHLLGIMFRFYLYKAQVNNQKAIFLRLYFYQAQGKNQKAMSIKLSKGSIDTWRGLGLRHAWVCWDGCMRQARTSLCPHAAFVLGLQLRV